jgi:hypothetical protein
MAYGLAFHCDMQQSSQAGFLRIKSADVLPNTHERLLHRVLGGIIGSSWTLDGAFMSPDRQVLGRGAPTP